MSGLVLGTRGSPLALWQARHVADLLRAEHPALTIEERVIKTEGDLRPQQPLISLGDHGVFVRLLEQALVSGAIDLAVHSLKDMPTDQPAELAIGAVLERRDPRDALVSVEPFTLENIPAGTRVGTGSPRRRSQLLHARPELRIESVRGNVGTRIQHLRDGRFGALVLALAGIERLGIDKVCVQPLSTAECLPAVGQGALAVEIRRSDHALRDRLHPLNHQPTLAAVTAERAFLRRLGGGCLAPATAYGRLQEGLLVLEAVVGDPDGTCLLSERGKCHSSEAAAAGAVMAERMLAGGAAELLRRARVSAEV